MSIGVEIETTTEELEVSIEGRRNNRNSNVNHTRMSGNGNGRQIPIAAEGAEPTKAAIINECWGFATREPKGEIRSESGDAARDGISSITQRGRLDSVGAGVIKNEGEEGGEVKKEAIR